MKSFGLKKTGLLCFLGGAVATLVGSQALKSGAVRKVCVKGLATGMKLQKEAQASLQNLKEDAEDICHDAKKAAKVAE